MIMSYSYRFMSYDFPKMYNCFSKCDFVFACLMLAAVSASFKEGNFFVLKVHRSKAYLYSNHLIIWIIVWTDSW